MNLFKSSVLCGMVIVSFMTSCTDVDITMPKGPKGDTGFQPTSFGRKKLRMEPSTGRRIRQKSLTSSSFSREKMAKTGRMVRVLSSSGKT